MKTAGRAFEAKFMFSALHGRGTDSAVTMRADPFRHLKRTACEGTSITKRGEYGAQLLEYIALRRFDILPDSNTVMLTVRSDPNRRELIGGKAKGCACVIAWNVQAIITQQQFIPTKYEVHLSSLYF